MGPGVKCRPAAVLEQQRGGMSHGASRKKTRSAVGTLKERFEKHELSRSCSITKDSTSKQVTQASKRVPQIGCRVSGRQEHPSQARREGTTRGQPPSVRSLTGMTGIAWSFEDPSAAAKVDQGLPQRSRQAEGEGWFGRRDHGSAPPQPSRAQLATMPGKNELRGNASGNAPGSAHPVRPAAQRACAELRRICSRRKRGPLVAIQSAVKA